MLCTADLSLSVCVLVSLYPSIPISALSHELLLLSLPASIFKGGFRPIQVICSLEENAWHELRNSRILHFSLPLLCKCTCWSDWLFVSACCIINLLGLHVEQFLSICIHCLLPVGAVCRWVDSLLYNVVML